MAISVNTDGLRRIDQIRRGLGVVTGDPATLHLGEAEIIDLLQTRQPSWLLVTDDLPAGDLARRRGIAVIDTPRVLADCYASGEIACPAAYELLEEMATKGRGVRVPLHHRDVCP